jgi:multimeric flavodoxin WrbA
MKILGVSGSPIPDSNTDRVLKAVLNATGAETEFVKLADYSIEPCRACLGCVETNRCVIEDDGIIMAEKARDADALIVAGFTPYSTLDARTKAFLERLYPLRHKHGFMRGKPGAAVVTSAVPGGSEMLPHAAQLAADAVMYYMMEEGMNFVGGIKVLGNVPCIKCGHGDDCPMSGVKMIYGTEASVNSVGVNLCENQPRVLQEAESLGKQIGKILASG